MKTHAFALLCVALAACAAPDRPAAAGAGREASPPAMLAGTRWVAPIEGMAEERRPRLEFQQGGRLAGYTGCNMLSGSWRLEGGEVRVGSVAMTKRLCTGPEGDAEKRVTAALNDQSRIRREGPMLVAETPAGARFEFVEARR